MAAASMFMAASCMDENDITEKPAASPATSNYEFVEGDVIVKFKSGASSNGARQANLLSVAQAEFVETIRGSEVRADASGRQVETGSVVLAISKLGTFEAIERLKKLPEVEYAEPNFIYKHFDTSNDPYYTNGNLWGMYGNGTTPANQYGSQAGEIWPNLAAGSTGTKGVWIGIIDEGYMYTHEDLSPNAATNPGEVLDGVDNDGNGYVDDIYGWDFVGNDNTVFDGVDDDHGTHVAGTIGARGGNLTGVAGVVWNVSLMNAKFLGTSGGTTANAVRAVDYFTKLKEKVNVVATSNSWGGGGYSQALYDAIQRANNAGILFIAAAGNSSTNIDKNKSYPASYDNANIIAVASIDSNGKRSSFSNFGAKSVDLGAPGRGIYSTVPRSSESGVVSGYASYSGTSMATPHVTGAVALYAALYPTSNAAQIKSAIMNQVIPTGSLNGKCVSNGRLNVGDFLTQPN